MPWISVKESLPEYGQDVLFVNGKGQVSCGVRFPYEEGTDVWANENSIYFEDHVFQEWAVCLYWMPFPSSPHTQSITKET